MRKAAASLLLLLCAACAAEDRRSNPEPSPSETPTPTPDPAFPTPGSAPLALDVDYVSFRISWGEATDIVTPPGEFEYLVYVSDAPDVETLAQMAAKTPSFATSGTSSATIGGLKWDRRYYFNVSVKDEHGNETAYEMGQVDTLRPMYMFPAASVRGDSIGGRTGADAKCASAKAETWASLPCSTTHAILSFSPTDEIRDMEPTFGIPPKMVASGTDTHLLGGWGQMVSGQLSVSVYVAGLSSTSHHWTGSTGSGGLDESDPPRNCQGWDGPGEGSLGDHISGNWLVGGNGETNCTANDNPFMCICW